MYAVEFGVNFLYPSYTRFPADDVKFVNGDKTLQNAEVDDITVLINPQSKVLKGIAWTPGPQDREYKSFEQNATVALLKKCDRGSELLALCFVHKRNSDRELNADLFVNAGIGEETRLEGATFTKTVLGVDYSWKWSDDVADDEVPGNRAGGQGQGKGRQGLEVGLTAGAMLVVAAEEGCREAARREGELDSWQRCLLLRAGCPLRLTLEAGAGVKVEEKVVELGGSHSKGEGVA